MKLSTLSNKKVLVTGATGFIGYRLAEVLSKKENAQVIGAGRKLEKAQGLSEYGVKLLAPDLNNSRELEEAFADVEYVFHCAGALGGNAESAEKINVEVGRAIVKAAAAKGVQRIVHVSTVGVYDMGHTDVVEESTPLALDHASTYPRTKARGEKAVFEEGEKYNMEVVAIRPSMVYGPGNGVWTTMMYKNVCEGKPVYLGDGSYNFNPIYLNDVVDAMIKAATVKEAAGEAFNISSEITSWKNFMSYYGELCGKDPKGMPLFAARLMAFANKLPGIHLPIDRGFIEMATSNKFFPIDKARKVLNWQPSVSLEEGMEQTIQWLKEHVI